MFDRIIDVLLSIVGWFQFWTVVDQYERGVVLRFGRFQREVGPGLHWLIPFEVDRVLVDNVVIRTDNTRNMTFTLQDGTTVMASVIVRYRIDDVKKALLEVEGIDHVINDCVLGNVSDLIRRATWEDLPKPEFGEALNKVGKRQARRYGVAIENLQFSDLCRTHALSVAGN